MASEYMRRQFQDEKPDPPRQLTRLEQWKNWWDYHFWYVVVGIVIVAVLCNILWHYLGFGTVQPDYQIAYVGAEPLPQDLAAALETELAALGQDLNEDGTVTVQLNQYATDVSAATTGLYAIETAILADIENCDSCIFLLENPVEFQGSFQTLAKLDGTLPADRDFSGDGTYLSWSDCPVLTSLPLENVENGQSLLSNLFIARRGFWREQTAAYEAGCAALWNAITEGADI